VSSVAREPHPEDRSMVPVLNDVASPPAHRSCHYRGEMTLPLDRGVSG
jgi:hypothetical protein